MPATQAPISVFRFELLRYIPNVISGEAFNVAVLLHEGGRLIDARFAQEFRRLRCHPLADLDYLHALRHEFEERRLIGEGFAGYIGELRRNLSNSLQLTEPVAFHGFDALEEIERLFASFVATPTPAGRAGDGSEPQPGTRRALRRRMDDTLRRYHLFANGDRVQRDTKVSYGGARLQFTFDYSYPAAGGVRYVHGLALRDDLPQTEKLCFVYERLRARESEAVRLTAVLDQGIQDDVRELLRSGDIECRELGQLDELALAIRGELDL